ncbi:ankyrin repeat domain-containing protein [Streptomyces griseoviridis]
MTAGETGWAGTTWETWRDHDAIRRRLDAGADPEAYGHGRPLHLAAQWGSAEVVAELARRVVDVDATEDGVTALWQAVVDRRPENALALAAAGADPWRRSIGGWSPGRLGLAGPTPDLFAVPAGERLTDAEHATAVEAARLIDALGSFHHDGTGLACVAGIDAAEAVRRLKATPASREFADGVVEDPWDHELDETLPLVGVTSVPGGCVVTQPWGYAPQRAGVLRPLSAGTLCYGLYANPKSGNQGRVARDGSIIGSDLHPGGGIDEGDTSEQALFSYLYQGNAIAYACAYAGLRPVDARAVVGPPDLWVMLPERD